MNLLKKTGLGLVAAGGLTNEQIILLISILVTVLGMIQDYLEGRKNK